MGAVRTTIARAVAIGVTATTALAACGSEPAEVTTDEYLEALEAVCATTTAELDALPAPPEQISVVDFAGSASTALDNEASRMRRLDVPDELDADHRALVRNTEEQAAAWRDVADGAAAGDELTETTTLIASLLLGRDDLVGEMGAPACRRGTT